MKITAIAAVVFCALAQVSEAALIGTELGLQGIYQATSTSPVYSFTSLNTVTVREPGIEIPSVVRPTLLYIWRLWPKCFPQRRSM